MRVGGQRHAPAALPPGKTRYPLYSRLGGAPGPFWKGAENLAPNGIRSPDRPARSESLYRLSYPGPLLRQYNKQYISLKSVILNIRNNHFLLNWRVLKSFMKIKGYLSLNTFLLWHVASSLCIRSWKSRGNMVPSHSRVDRT